MWDEKFGTVVCEVWCSGADVKGDNEGLKADGKLGGVRSLEFREDMGNACMLDNILHREVSVTSSLLIGTYIPKIIHYRPSLQVWARNVSPSSSCAFTAHPYLVMKK